MKWIEYDKFKSITKEIQKDMRINLSNSVDNLYTNYENFLEIGNNYNYKIQYKGIKNLGNTCYLNNVIQVLYHKNDFKNSKQNLNIKKENANILYNIKNIFDELFSNINISYIIPEIFIYIFDNEIIDGHIQRDMGEFSFRFI